MVTEMAVELNSNNNVRLSVTGDEGEYLEWNKLTMFFDSSAAWMMKRLIYGLIDPHRTSGEVIRGINKLWKQRLNIATTAPVNQTRRYHPAYRIHGCAIHGYNSAAHCAKQALHQTADPRQSVFCRRCGCRENCCHRERYCAPQRDLPLRQTGTSRSPGGKQSCWYRSAQAESVAGHSRGAGCRRSAQSARRCRRYVYCPQSPPSGA